MKILAIETSCDETALALVDVDISSDHVSANLIQSEIFSQIDIHKEFGGVFPAVAKREHARHAPLLLKKMLASRDITSIKDPKTTDTTNQDTPNTIDTPTQTDPYLWATLEELLVREPGLFEATKDILLTYRKPDIDRIAVTAGPGLEPALWVGINFAKALSLFWNIPLIATNHMKGHIFAVLLNKQKIEFPALAFLMSGGHTELVRMNSLHHFEILGKTKDDAIGESYDKVARMLGFEYPGGPKIAQLAQEARTAGARSGDIILPRPMIHTQDLDFSFSGLKTSVLYKIRDLTQSGATPLSEELKLNIAHEFEEAVTDIILHKITRALQTFPARTLVISGGVIANTYLRSRITERAEQLGITLLLPKIEDSTDNAQMIAVAGAIESLNTSMTETSEIRASGNLSY